MRAAIHALTVAASLACAPVMAQDSTYQPWSPASNDLQKMVQELRALVDKADAARAADPNFIKDLRKLADTYGKIAGTQAPAPASTALISDDFKDGNFTAGPAWTVAAGKFSVDPAFGLRSTVGIPGGSASSGASGQDAATILLQAILGQIANQQSSGSTSSSTSPATIHTSARIGNTFSAEIEFGSLVAGGRIAFGPVVGSDVYAGYRLFYVSGSQPAIQLVALKKGQQAVIGSYYLNTALEDRKRHVLKWTRKAGGAMTVSLDGARLFSVTDQIFRDSFTGFAITNPGGDFVVRRVVVDIAG